MTQDKAHPTPSEYCRMDDGRCGICGGDWSVCGCQGMLDRRSRAAPVASNTTAEPAPIQPAGVEVERDAARYRWLRSGVRSRQGIVMKGGKRSIDQSSHRAMVEFDFWCSPEELDAAIDQALAAASQGDRGKT